MKSACRPVLIAIVLLITTPVIMYAQTDYKSEQDLIKQADKAFGAKQYLQALPMYSQIVSNHPDNANYNYALGVCLVEAGDNKEEAVKFLKLASTSPQTPDNVSLYLARALHSGGIYEEALVSLDDYKNRVSSSNWQQSLGPELILNCNNGISMRVVSGNAKHRIGESFRTQFDNFHLNYKFETHRGKFLKVPTEYETKESKGFSEGQYLFITADGKDMVFARNNDKSDNSFHLVGAHKDIANRFSEPQPFTTPLNLPQVNSAFPTMINSGKTIYFSMRGAKSMGGYDIFRSDLDPATGAWGAPVNMGTPVNSPANDYYYIPSEDGTFAYLLTDRGCMLGNYKVLKVTITGAEKGVAKIDGRIDCKACPSNMEIKISVVSNEDNTLASEFKILPESPDYVLRLNAPSTYTFTVSAPGFPVFTETVNLESADRKGYLQQILISRSSSGEEKMKLFTQKAGSDQIMAGAKNSMNDELAASPSLAMKSEAEGSRSAFKGDAGDLQHQNTEDDVSGSNTKIETNTTSKNSQTLHKNGVQIEGDQVTGSGVAGTKNSGGSSSNVAGTSSAGGTSSKVAGSTTMAAGTIGAANNKSSGQSSDAPANSNNNTTEQNLSGSSVDASQNGNGIIGTPESDNTTAKQREAVDNVNAMAQGNIELMEGDANNELITGEFTATQAAAENEVDREVNMIEDGDESATAESVESNSGIAATEIPDDKGTKTNGTSMFSDTKDTAPVTDTSGDISTMTSSNTDPLKGGASTSLITGEFTAEQAKLSGATMASADSPDVSNNESQTPAETVISNGSIVSDNLKTTNLSDEQAINEMGEAGIVEGAETSGATSRETLAMQTVGSTTKGVAANEEEAGLITGEFSAEQAKLNGANITDVDVPPSDKGTSTLRSADANSESQEEEKGQEQTEAVDLQYSASVTSAPSSVTNSAIRAEETKDENTEAPVSVNASQLNNAATKSNEDLENTSTSEAKRESLTMQTAGKTNTGVNNDTDADNVITGEFNASMNKLSGANMAAGDTPPPSDAENNVVTTFTIIPEALEKYPDLVFKVQVGAFTQKTAEEHVKYFETQGLKLVTNAVNQSGMTTVMSGSFNSYQEAGENRDKIRAAGYPDAFVVAFSGDKRLAINEVIRTETQE